MSGIETLHEKKTKYFDIIIIGGEVVDGSLAPRKKLDIGICGDKIAEIAEPGALNDSNAKTINATGKIISPGFIDSHTHDDNALLKAPEMIPKISQGVTTVISGNCGISLAPLIPKGNLPPPLNILGPKSDFTFESLSQYILAFEHAKPTINTAMLVGHNTLRIAAVKDLTRPANKTELKLMQELLEIGMKEGAIGFSTGTYYRPSRAADESEIIALAEVISPYKGIYATHMRDEQTKIFKSMDETFETAKTAQVRVLISHHKCASPDVWGRSAETLALIHGAQKSQEVATDVYPYNAGSTILEPEYVDERIRIFISWSEPHPEMIGRDLSDIADDWGVSQKEAVERLKPGGGVYFSMDEEDVRRILSDPTSMIGSDGLPNDINPHPRLWGTFPRVLGHYCREEGLFSLETAIHKMTGLTASYFRISDRGFIRKGNFADLVIFDEKKILDLATYSNPKKIACGIDAVFVNGSLSWLDGALTGARKGRFLKHSHR